MLRVFMLFLLVREFKLHQQEPNYCRTNEAYIDFNSRECFYNPAIGANAMQMIVNNGYQYNTYEAVTSDGYILNLFRIFKNKNTERKHVIYIQHGLMSDAGNFLTHGKSGLAFQLVENGFDVFLGNSRGTPYSREHINPNISHEDYWNFSFEEIANYDVPASLEKISEITKTNDILYIGHSMGGAISAIYASQNKYHAQKYIKAFINIAPVIHFENYDSPLKYLSRYLNIFQGIMNYFNIHAFNDNKFLQPFLIIFCSRYPTVTLCTKMLDSSLGNSSISRRSDIVPLLASQLSSCSMKSVYHYLQILKNEGKFLRYDHGWRKNYLIYEDFKPPEYNLNEVNSPMYVFYSAHDLLAHQQSVKKFYNTISSEEKKLIKIPENDAILFNHHDFLNSENNKDLFHKPFFKLLETIYK